MSRAGSSSSEVLKKILLLVAAALFLLGLSAWYGWERYGKFLQTPLDIPAGGLVFQLEPGTAGVDIVNQLGLLGVTQPGWEWRLLMRLEPHLYRAGEYRLESGIKPQEILGKLSSGQVIQYRITLVEGWTFQQFAAALAGNTVLKHELDLESPSQWPLVASSLGIAHPEGWCLPETYQFTRGDSDRGVLVRAHAAMEQALEEAWESRIEDLPFDSRYELLILASIIEKETSLDEERGPVAGVFTRRLQKGMRLQTDPTVIYGLGDSFDGDIRRRDLQTDTPYNTYTRHGLPPTPIAMPGKASLMAAARPAPGDALFFVADGHGGHTFSATLEAHREAVKKLMERN
jgi:UPF0755 protein